MESHEVNVTDAAPSSLPHLLLRPTEAAEVLGVSRATIYRLLDDGSLGSVWVRSLRRIPMEEIERYIGELTASHEVDPQVAAPIPEVARFDGSGRA